MSNLSTCASEIQMSHVFSWNFRLSVLCTVLSSLATFILSPYAIKCINNMSTFPSSTKMILFLNLFYANLHQLIYGTISVSTIYKSLFLSDQPCQWLEAEHQCLPYSILLYAGMGGIIYSQTGALIERAIATFHSNYTPRLSQIIGIIISVSVFIFSSVHYRIITWDDPMDGYILSCFFNPSHSFMRINIFLVIAFSLTLFNLVASMALMRYNKKMEYSDRVRFKVPERFKKREAIDSTHTICTISLTQFVFRLIFSLGILLLKMNRDNIGLPVYLSAVIWIYTVPYSALLLPIILIYRIRATKVQRTRRIRDITGTKQTQNEHMNQIASMWN